jgi:hypothetical protein
MPSNKDFPGEVDQLDQLVRSRAFGANRAERQLPTTVPRHEQRHGDLRLDAPRERSTTMSFVQDLAKLIAIRIWAASRYWAAEAALGMALSG